AILGMSFGKAIIAPCLGCIPEILKSEGSILYDPNDKYGLLKAMKLALASKNKIVEMGKSNSELAKKMDWKDIAASTGKVYFECRGK
ncbi:MAG: glycosyltransferase, partial [Desulfobacterales bacterium]